MSRRAAFLSVIVLFVASLLIRIPFLNRPLDGEHDWLTLHTLLTVSIWNTTGLQASHYSLVMTWPNAADRFISYFDPRATVQDAQGNSYFIAFPPFAFLLAFGFLKLFHLQPSAIWLKCINLALLAPATVCLYLLLQRLFAPDRLPVGRWLSVLGVALFLFDRSVLLSLGNLYFPLILIVPIWIVSVYVYCSLQDSEHVRFAGFAGFFALVFVMCYCDWLGYAAAGTFVLGAVFRKPLRRTNVWLAAVCIAAPLTAGTLTVMQYASIGGLRAFVAALAFRLQDRAGLTAHSDQGLTLWSRHAYQNIASLYVQQHMALLLMIWGLGCIWLLSSRRLSLSTWTNQAKRLVFLFSLPVIADHVLLVNHTAIHNYANLKSTPVLTVLFVLLLSDAIRPLGAGAQAPESWGIIERSWARRASVLTVFVCLLSAKSYLEVRNDLRKDSSRLGGEIHAMTKRDEVIFLEKRYPDDYVTPNLIYFSGRNIQMIADDRQATAFLREHNERQGIVLHATLEGDLVSAQELAGPDFTSAANRSGQLTLTTAAR
jgi:hypothetical protein